ncbi:MULTISPECIES: DoxX family protein [Aeromonas]|jgi:putative oxidoreductase|uniref:DoxX family protein n=6 Tax=Bacteria TaxID=2 RepID=A0A3L0W2M7_ECOLX|nr:MULTISPECIES: DoxX family protein [Aeromonas]MBP6141059.1 DoxX family protein [Aeromonas sp.]ABO91971.1 membrane protein [Aeromonas salmonicida subsp. salmonicida A449]ARW84075.1 putative membrane protein [Aeromonas salmonicida]ASI21872.1 DoxX family protein [Aeromonas salmonicida]ASI26189.1 DoxX family protein [Aeromonas salmonicida]
MDKMKDMALLVGRVLLALMFVMAGWSKIGGYAGTQGYMEAMGVPGFMLPLVILLELGGGLAVVLGLFTRSIAVLLAGFTLMAAFIFHYQPADQMQMLMFMKNVSVAGGFLALAAAGAGAFSLDARLGKNW